MLLHSTGMMILKGLENFNTVTIRRTELSLASVNGSKGELEANKTTEVPKEQQQPLEDIDMALKSSYSTYQPALYSPLTRSTSYPCAPFAWTQTFLQCYITDSGRLNKLYCNSRYLKRHGGI